MDGCTAKECAAYTNALVLRRTAAGASYLGLQAMHSLVGWSRPRPSIVVPTKVGVTVTGPQDRGKLHEDRAAEGVSR